MLRVGVIADTHGLLRPEAIAFLRGSHHLIHAGDIGKAAILEELAALAPVTAVRGNNDEGAWAHALGERAGVWIGGICLHVVHDLADLDIDPVAAGVRVVISGHSHKSRQQVRDGVLYLNPGSAGPRRFKLPITLAELLIRSDSLPLRSAASVDQCGIPGGGKLPIPRQLSESEHPRGAGIEVTARIVALA